jgi:hypothetical protein
MFEKKGEQEQKKMTREQAFELIAGWVEKTKSRQYGESLLELQDILWVAVRDERLCLDENSKLKFKYVLDEPIMNKAGTETVLSMVTIQRTMMSQVLKMEQIKNNEEKAYKMIESFCRDSEGETIEQGFIMRLDSRDSVIIQSVIGSFFF